jgi:hypothetical protein
MQGKPLAYPSFRSAEGKKKNQMKVKDIKTTIWLGTYACEVSSREKSDVGIPIVFHAVAAAALVATILLSEMIRR